MVPHPKRGRFGPSHRVASSVAKCTREGVRITATTNAEPRRVFTNPAVLTERRRLKSLVLGTESGGLGPKRPKCPEKAADYLSVFLPEVVVGRIKSGRRAVKLGA